MNHLAHLYLAEDHAASRIGNLLGDFVTGRPGSLDLPAPVVAGIVRHRAIDRFTDDHPAVVEARGWIGPERRRFANAILDICFDHFLVLDWDHRLPLRSFLDRVYDEQRTHCGWLPEELSSDLELRIADDWLGHYGSEAGLAEVFARVAERRPACAAIGGAMADFHQHRAGFERTYATLVPDLRKWIGTLGPERLAPEGRDRHD